MSIDRDTFLAQAKPLNIIIEGKPLVADVKEFSSGSLGWYANGKVTQEVGGKTVSVQVGLNLTIVGTKPKVKV
jgi:hypothetical protein